jgi:hypothetical protein
LAREVSGRDAGGSPTFAEPLPWSTPRLTATDRQFISVLDNMGIRYPDITYAIGHARAVCDFMETRRGTAAPPSAFVENPTIWTGLNAVEFAQYGACYYCPQFASE